MKKCLYCNADLSDEAVFCDQCGRKQETPVSQEPQEPIETAADVQSAPKQPEEIKKQGGFRKFLHILGTAVRWILGLLIVLMGISTIVGSSPVQGILYVVMGLLVLPPITKMIPRFKGRKIVLVLCFIALFAVSQAVPKIMVQMELDKQEKQAALPREPVDAEALTAWLTETLSETGDFNEKEVEQWELSSQDEFLPVWKQVVSTQLAEMDETDLEKVSEYLSRAVKLYWAIFGGQKEGDVRTISQNVDGLSSCLAANQKLEDKYGAKVVSKYFDSYGSCYESDTFYINQRLESSGTLASLAKEFGIDTSGSTSDWVAYDVGDLYGTAYPTGDYRVIHANTKNPFDSSGVWTVDYFDTGATTELTDSSGFVKTVPVYQMISNTETVQTDADSYMENKIQCYEYYSAIKSVLNGETPVETASADVQPIETEQSDSTAAQTTSTESQPDSATTTQVNIPSAYEPVIESYQTALKDGFDVEIPEYLGLNFQLNYLLSPENSETKNVGYAILDINGDGVQELLVGVNGEYKGQRGEIYDLYTIANGEAELIAQCEERIQYTLCTGGYIKVSSSSSAFESQYSYYDLILDRYDGNEGGWLSLRETIFYDEIVGSEKEPWFYASGSGVMSAEDALPISGDEAHTIMDAYQVAPITYTPFLK